VLAAPEQAHLWKELGLEVVASSPEEFAAHLDREQAKWGKVIKQRGIKAE